MKNIAKKYMVYLIPAICIGFVTAYSSLESGEKAILRLMDAALEETITIDYHRRADLEIRTMNEPLNRKIKTIEIIGENGIETIELQDSIEKYQAAQSAMQLLLAEEHPINPNEFNAIFKEKLNTKGITSHTGVIYRHREKPRFSNNDSITFHKAILTKPVILDLNNTISIQVWADCDWFTLLRYTNKGETFLFVFILLAISSITTILLYKRKKESVFPTAAINTPQEPVEQSVIFPNLNIRIDEEKQKIYIDDKECPTTKMGFKLLSLLIREQDHFATRERIMQELWPQEIKGDYSSLNNRIDGHINILRKALKDFPGYQIITEPGKGYQLSYP